MKTCTKCGRTFGPDAQVCAYDQTPLFAADPAPGRPAQGQPQVGEVLGSYRILEQIGRGGMGTIFRAEHTRLGRQVALKVLKQEMVRETEMVRRFFEEARAVNEIGHDNIVDVVDFVENYGANPPLVYMVMELLRGQDLRSRINAVGAMDELEAVEIAAQVASTLFAVHRVKILHRDLKPENIFLLRADPAKEATDEAETGLWDWRVNRGQANVTVKLLDFGVVSFFGERGGDKITEPGVCLGTPEYMAPEQILGRDLDERTDVYALGVLLYEMLVGASPFTSTSGNEVMVQQVRDRPAPIAERRSVAPISPELEALVLRCLEKQPQQRFQNMRELYKALRHVPEGKGVPSSNLGLTGEVTSPDGAARQAPERHRVTDETRQEGPRGRGAPPPASSVPTGSWEPSGATTREYGRPGQLVRRLLLQRRWILAGVVVLAVAAALVWISRGGEPAAGEGAAERTRRPREAPLPGAVAPPHRSVATRAGAPAVRPDASVDDIVDERPVAETKTTPSDPGVGVPGVQRVPSRVRRSSRRGPPQAGRRAARHRRALAPPARRAAHKRPAESAPAKRKPAGEIDLKAVKTVNPFDNP